MSGLLKMPRMGETMEEGKIVAWLVEPGAPFKRGDALLEVETDKTVVEFPALADGTLIKPLIQIGEMVDVGTPIAEIDIGEGPDWTDDGRPPEKEISTNLTSALNNPNVEASASDLAQVHGQLRATPAARRLAKKYGADLLSIAGSGRRGRVEKADVEAAVSSGPKSVGLGLEFGYGLAWSEMGQKNDAPVLFIHGFAADNTAWVGIQSQLARSGCYTVSVDLPGHGAATKDINHYSDLRQGLQKVLDHCFGSRPVHVVAHSMGAIAALQLADGRTFASLTLLAPAGLGRRINTKFLDALSAPQSVEQVKVALEKLTSGANGLSDQAVKKIYKDLVKGRLAKLADTLVGASGQAVDIRDSLKRVAEEIPVSIIIGDRDEILDGSEMLDVSPMIAVHHFSKAGHMPHWEALSEVQMILQRKIKA